MVSHQPGAAFPVLMVQDVRKVYQMGDSEVHALKGVSLAVRQGELVAIMGTSGSGKSTLLQIVGCLDRPTHGAVYIDGQDVSTMPDIEIARVRNRKLGFIFQAFNLMPHETASHNVEVPLQYAGVSRKDRRRMAVEALTAVGLGDRVDHKPAELSGGQRQRVAIARAIVNQPLVILADEPTGALDVKSGLDVMDILQGLNNQGRTIVMVTHDPNIAQHAQRIIKISDGLVVEEELVSSPRRAAAESVGQAVAPAAPLEAGTRVRAAPECRRCHKENRPGAAYCRDCGFALAGAQPAAGEILAEVAPTTRCPACGSENRPGAKFCRNCGAAAAGPPGRTVLR
jgi:putative ABC transport system ATP-binding protein